MATTNTITILTADRSEVVLSNIRNKVMEATLSGKLFSEEKLVLRLVTDLDDAELITPGMVVRLDSVDMEYRVRGREEAYDGTGSPVVEAYALWHDLQDRFVRRSGTLRTDPTFSIVKRSPSAALAEIMASAPTGWSAGTVASALSDATPEVTMSMYGMDVLRAVATLADAVHGEWQVRVVNSSGTRSYYIDLVESVGAAGNVVIQQDTVGPSNALGLRRKRHAEEYFSRLIAILGDEAENVTLADAVWTVTGVERQGPATAYTLQGAPIPFDDAFVGYFFGTTADGFYRIMDTVAPNVVKLRTSHDGLVKGQFAQNTQGKLLDFIPILAATEGAFGAVERAETFQGAPVPNLLRVNDISDDFGTFEGGAPTGWNLVGTPAVEQVTESDGAVIGSALCRIQADEGEGLITDPIAEIPGGLVSAWLAMRLEAGEAVVDILDANDIAYPEEEQAATNSRTTRALSIGGVSGFTPPIRLRVRALQNETVIVLDAATLTGSASPYDWAEIMGPNDLWTEAGRVVEADGGAVYDELSGEMVDLSNIIPETYDRVELGSSIDVQAGRKGDGTYRLAFTTRVTALERRLIGSDQTVRVTLERERADLVDLLTQIRNRQRSEIEAANRIRREKPILRVTREEGVTSVTFTLEPLDGRGRPLTNYVIYVDDGDGTFDAYATDQASLVVDPGDLYPTGGGYTGPRFDPDEVEVEIEYPASTEVALKARFYVQHKTSGLYSDVLEYWVENPNTDASRIDGRVTAAQLRADTQRYGKDFDFTATAWDEVEWTAGDLTLADGRVFPIAAGTTGSMAAATEYFIYFNADGASEETDNTLTVTTTPAESTGDDKILLCWARAASSSNQDAMVIPGIGRVGLNEENLSANSVSADTVQANAIRSIHIDALAVRAEHIEAEAIALTHLDFLPLLSTGADENAIIATINASEEGITITGEKLTINSSTTFAVGYNPNTKTETQIGSSEPTTRADGSALVAGDTWIDTSSGANLQKKWNGSAWIVGTTTIDGGYIQTNTIEADRLNVSTLSAITADLGTVTAGKGTFGNFAIGAGVESTNDGVYVSTTGDYWYDTGAFRFGGANGISYSGSGDVAIGTGATFAGNLTGSSMELSGDLDVSGSITVGTGGEITNTGGDYTIGPGGISLVAGSVYAAASSITWDNGFRIGALTSGPVTSAVIDGVRFLEIDTSDGTGISGGVWVDTLVASISLSVGANAVRHAGDTAFGAFTAGTPTTNGKVVLQIGSNTYTLMTTT